MFFYICLSACFVIKAAKDNLYVGLESGSSMFTMMDRFLDATNFYLSPKDKGNPLENYIRVGTEKYFDLTYGGRAILRKPYNLSSVDSFKLNLTSGGAYTLQKGGKCLGYGKSSKSIELTRCDNLDDNIFFVFEGHESSHRMIHDLGFSDDIKLKNDSIFNSYHNDYRSGFRRNFQHDFSDHY